MCVVSLLKSTGLKFTRNTAILVELHLCTNFSALVIQANSDNF